MNCMRLGHIYVIREIRGTVQRLEYFARPDFGGYKYLKHDVKGTSTEHTMREII